MNEHNTKITQQNYRTLVELFPKMMDGTYSYMRLQAGEGFMPLTFERLYDNRYSLMHFYMQNGDMMRDPDIELEIDHQNKTVEALSFTQHPYIYYEVEPGSSGTKLQAELNGFLSQWLSNIREQEYQPEKAYQYDSAGNQHSVYFNADKAPQEQRQEVDRAMYYGWNGTPGIDI